MLANQLGVLLAQRQLTIKQVVEDLEISRSALSNMVNNPKANISTVNIDKLCNYLGVSPSNFFIYAPYSFEFYSNFILDKDTKAEDDHAYVFVTSTYKRTETNFSYEVYVRTTDYDVSYSDVPGKYDLYVSIADEDPDDNSLKTIYEELPVAFQNDLSSKLVNEMIRVITANRTNMSLLNTPRKNRNTLNEFIESVDKKDISVAFDLPWIRMKKKLNVKKFIFS